jgi:hypothetical protein
MVAASRESNERIKKMRGQNPAKMQRWLASIFGDPNDLVK